LPFVRKIPEQITNICNSAQADADFYSVFSSIVFRNPVPDLLNFSKSPRQRNGPSDHPHPFISLRY
jgi:hypothetical protein